MLNPGSNREAGRGAAGLSSEYRYSDVRSGRIVPAAVVSCLRG